MAEKKIEIKPTEGVNELVLRDGKASNILDIKPPLKLSISGTIHAPFLFLEKRWDVINNTTDGWPGAKNIPKQIEPSRSHVIVDRNTVSIELTINENDDYCKGTITGKLDTNPKFVEFGINDPKKEWNPNKLGQFLKMNRACFEDVNENMKLVSDLKNFRANVDSNIEQQKSDNGSFADNYSATIESNLPENFTIKIPLFKGFPAEVIEVEFYASVDGRDFSLQLISPGAQQAYDQVRDSIIDEQIKLITGLAPELPIIEK